MTKKTLVPLASLLLSISAQAATQDPCATTFASIATALEQGKADVALTYFTTGDRATKVIQDAAATSQAAASLAAVFRTATLKSTFDTSAIYTANWAASAGHTYPIDIGVQVSETGCKVQAW